MQTSLGKQDATFVAANYVFDKAEEYAKVRYHDLSAPYDARTILHLEQLDIQRWACLEVGGGSGSIASWLCDRLGDQGRVLAIDVLSIFPDSAVNKTEEQLKTIRAFYRVMTSRGIEMRNGRRLPQQLRERGLANVGAEGTRKFSGNKYVQAQLRGARGFNPSFRTDLRGRIRSRHEAPGPAGFSDVLSDDVDSLWTSS